MIDYFFKFASEAAAIADASGTIYYTPAANGNPGSWNPDRVVPNLQVWRASQDVAGTTTGPDGSTIPTVTHTYLPGWYACVSLSASVATLRNHAALQVMLDRDKLAQGLPFVIKSNLTAPILQDIRFSPVFAGFPIPFGNLS